MKRNVFTHIVVFGIVLFSNCNKKPKEEPPKVAPTQMKAVNVVTPPMNTPPVMKAPVMKAPVMKAEAPPMAAQVPPMATVTQNANQEALPIPTGSEIPHSQCNAIYGSGTASFRAKKFDDAVDAFAKYITGQCFDRISNTMDLWLTQWGFLSACQTSTRKHLLAFKTFRAKACKKYGDAIPCDKPPRCPGEKSKHEKCNELYTKGSAAFNKKDFTTALTSLTEFEKGECFGLINTSVDLWASYRGVKAAESLKKPTGSFLEQLKKVCKGQPGAWACKQAFKKR
ncbi:hypothetical protein KKF84_12560 [Myxococcota bacterium]|nr:hypothetical protein [Myxococcota bacterium]MBU1536147.1 hypothetical protein [Myxococcota bacterium]